MRLSQYFLPILREDPKEAEIISHRLMLRSGMIRQSSSGIYSWLPLGYKVLQNIANIVREEQNKAGAVEMLMPTIQSADLWKESGRYDDYGKEMLRITDRHDRDMLYGPTNEELITEIFRSNIKSYKELPQNLYHIQWKFRDEIRPRFGVMRGREFYMKDGYSFDISSAAGKQSYNKMFIAYLKTFKRLGVKAIPMAADTGPIGGDMSHEFIILAKTGESQVYCHKDFLDMDVPDDSIDLNSDLENILAPWKNTYAVTEEKFLEADFHSSVPENKRIEARGIEVGHIFFFGDKYTKAMNCLVQNNDGKQVAPQCGSYGIGVSRLVGAIIEACHDEAGIIWPESVAPFKIGLINLKMGDEETDKVCSYIYKELNLQGIETLYDDRDERAGAKFSTMDLIGIPWQIIVGPKCLKNGLIEIKNRSTGEKEETSCDDIICKFTKHFK